MQPKLKHISDLHESVGRDHLQDRIRSMISPLPVDESESKATSERIPRIRFFSPSELRAYKPETDIVLVGNCHIMRGEVFVIGGEPGVGKSKGSTSLAVAGATGASWFGLKIHRPFRTMIVQTENGRYRLQQEYASLACEQLDEWIRAS